MSVPSNREETLFERALGIDLPEARDAFLREGCGDDVAMLARLQGLLGAHDRAGKFLEHKPAAPGVPPSGGPAGEPAEAGTSNPPSATLTEKPGDCIGRYKLLEEIGQGGFGTVWMAEQEEPVRRRVALKVVKLGMDTRQVLARFEAERQALALMDHPNIARVFDGGATGHPLPSDGRGAEGVPESQISNSQSQIPAGRPYFVMELVRGLPITKYCDETKLSTRQRLELFGQVCRAVQHAHQKGIIHRDLKPSNILVTVQDDRPVVKVIDFGIAKATEGRLTEKTLFTGFQQLVGTPAYMSPEQASLGSLDIDTRSDTYSLGVVLYELLTGRPPFDTKELLKEGYEAVLRTIRETEPMKPSTRLSDFVAADVRRLTAAESEQDRASSRRLLQERKELISELRGDLDWIVMKCLEKDRTRRYESATGLATDIERYLHDEPVLARPPSNLYRVLKMMRRNTLAFGAAAAVLLALVIGLGFSTWAFLRERAAREQARQVAQFLKDMLEGVGPSVAVGRDTQMLQEILDKTAGRVGKSLKGQPEVEAELRNTIGEVYRALGEYEKAASMFREALERAKRFGGNDHQLVAASCRNLAGVLLDMGNPSEAEALSRVALALFRKLLGKEHTEVAASLNNFGNVLYFQGKLPEAEIVYREALAMRRKLLGDSDTDVAATLNDLALVLRDQGRLVEAENMFGESLATWRKRRIDGHPDVATALNNLGLVLADEGKLNGAESRFGEALAMWRKLAGKEDHLKVAEVLDNLGVLFRRQFRLSEAEARHLEALAIKRKLLGETNTSVATSLHNLAQALTEQGRFSDAEVAQRQALAIFQRALRGKHAYVAIALNNLANVFYMQGKLADAETTYRTALAMQREVSGDVHPQVAITMDGLGFVLTEARKLEEAERLVRGALAMRLQLFGNENPAVAKSLHSLASLLDKQGRFVECETKYQEAIALRRKILGEDNPEVARSLNALASMMQRLDKLTESEPLAREALGILEKRLPDDWQRFSSRSLLGASLAGQRNYAEAEPLLLSGFDGMNRRESAIPPDGKPRLKQAAERMAQFYEATGNFDEATEWRRRLNAPPAKVQP